MHYHEHVVKVLHVQHLYRYPHVQGGAPVLAYYVWYGDWTGVEALGFPTIWSGITMPFGQPPPHYIHGSKCRLHNTLVAHLLKP
jgi:hypothetical protein